MQVGSKTQNCARHWDEAVRETARALAETGAFARSQRQRKKVEMRFGHLKQHLGLRRLKLRDLKGTNEEVTLAATTQNIKALATFLFPPRRSDQNVCSITHSL